MRSPDEVATRTDEGKEYAPYPREGLTRGECGDFMVILLLPYGPEAYAPGEQVDFCADVGARFGSSKVPM
jgi:hypothetical protein